MLQRTQNRGRNHVQAAEHLDSDAMLKHVEQSGKL